MSSTRRGAAQAGANKSRGGRGRTTKTQDKIDQEQARVDYEIELISFVEQKSELYDKNDNAYSKRENVAVWNQFSKTHNETPDQTKANWNKLRTAYNRAIKGSKSTGQSGKEKKKWHHLERMAFLGNDNKRVSEPLGPVIVVNSDGMF